MDLFRFALKNEIATLAKDDTKLLFIGDKSHMPMDIQDMMNDAEKLTANNSSTTLAIAVSYGGRSEIVEACGRLKQESVEVSESAVTSHLYTAGLPDPDIILRTGGQKRLSGFLPWQCIYSELFFTDTLWPDYSKDEFEAMLKEYSERQRNFGK